MKKKRFSRENFVRKIYNFFGKNQFSVEDGPHSDPRLHPHQQRSGPIFPPTVQKLLSHTPFKLLFLLFLVPAVSHRLKFKRRQHCSSSSPAACCRIFLVSTTVLHKPSWSSVSRRRTLFLSRSNTIPFRTHMQSAVICVLLLKWIMLLQHLQQLFIVLKFSNICFFFFFWKNGKFFTAIFYFEFLSFVYILLNFS